jgi:adenine-specific DNA methylase
MERQGYSQAWVEALGAYLAASIDRLADHSTSLATWYLQGENVKHTFVRYALPITWDYAETNTLYDGGGSWTSAISFCSAALEHTLSATSKSFPPTVVMASATQKLRESEFDLIVTDPPYYDAIPYAVM